MPLSRSKKEQVVENVEQLLKTSKLTVIARYQGMSVKDMQTLRSQAKTGNTTIKVVKNRLVMQSIKHLEQYKNLDLSQLQGMLIYAFNPEDEVAPAQSIATFAKQKPIVEFVGAITTEGKWLDAEQVKTLADLPNKPVLIGSVIALLQSPIRSIVAATNGNLTNIISGLKAKAA